MPKIKRLANRKTAVKPADLSSSYNITAKKALELNVPPPATPYVDRPARTKEWGVVGTSEGPETLHTTYTFPEDHEAAGETWSLAGGQGQLLFGDVGAWEDTIDPANLPRHSSGTAEERRAAASEIPGLESERTRPSRLKEFARHMSYKNIWAPPREVRDPSHVKDLLAESGMPPGHIEAMAVSGTQFKENSRRLTLKQKIKGEGTMGEGKWDRPRDFYSTVDKKLEPLSEVNITSRSGFHSGGTFQGTGATTPGDVVVHESGHALHDMVSGVDALNVFGRYMKGAFWSSGPQAATGEDPHKEGVADAYREQYASPEGPKSPADPDRQVGYGIAAEAWRNEDPVMKHAYETTRLHTMGGSELAHPGPPGPPGSKPEEPAKALLGMEPARKGRDPVLGTLKRLVNPDSDYVRTMYGTKQAEGGADTIGERVNMEAYDEPPVMYDDQKWAGNGMVWTTAGRDYAENVLSNIQISPALNYMDLLAPHSTPPWRGEQQSLFPDIVPHHDLRENVRDLDVEEQRAGEEHLNKVKSNLKTWLV